MTLIEQQIFFEGFSKEMKDIIFKKGNDYANEDRLSNFKLAGAISGLTPELNCLSLISTKVARLGVLLKSENAPNNESIHDTLIDLANYSCLLAMIQDDIDVTKSTNPKPHTRPSI